MAGPRIVVTLTNPERAADPLAASAKNQLYLDAVARHGGRPVALDERCSADERSSAFDSMDGLLISGGADLDPALYGETLNGANAPDPGRDEIDAAAFSAAAARGIPILGVCRGLQAVNVFSGGGLVQHVDDHESLPYPAHAAEATRHDLRLVPGTRLHRLLHGQSEIEVNSFHHQAVDRTRLAPGRRASGLVAHDGGDLVEALEAEDDERWLFAIQCHPERRESSPHELGALWEAFVKAAS
jgi:putative glutamine amidotransferase